MLIVSLVASVVALAVGCLGLLGFCLWLLKQQRRQAEEQAKRDAIRDRRIKELAQQLEVFAEGSMRMGERLDELNRVVSPLPERMVQLEQRDPNNFSSPRPPSWLAWAPASMI